MDMPHKSKMININLSQLIKLSENFNFEKLLGKELLEKWIKEWFKTLRRDIFVDHPLWPYEVRSGEEMIMKMQREENPSLAPPFSEEYLFRKMREKGHQDIHVFEGDLKKGVMDPISVQKYKGKNEEEGIKIIMPTRYKSDSQGNITDIAPIHESRASFLRAGVILAWPALRDILMEVLEEKIKGL